MSVQVSTRVDAATKRQFDRVCEGIGTTPSNALSMFIQGVIHHNGRPFHMVIPSGTSEEESDAIKREILRSLRGSCVDPTMVAPPDIPMETPEEDLGNSPGLSVEEKKRRLRELYGSCDDPTMVEPPEIPWEYDAPRRYDLI